MEGWMIDRWVEFLLAYLVVLRLNSPPCASPFPRPSPWPQVLAAELPHLEATRTLQGSELSFACGGIDRIVRGRNQTSPLP